MDNFLEMVERIWALSFVRAAVYLLIALLAGWLVAFLVKRVMLMIIPKRRRERWENRGANVLKMTGKLVFLIVFLLFLPTVFEALGLDSVSAPITDFVNTFIAYIPNIIAAAILVFIGVFLGEIVEEVVSALLMKTKLDDLTRRLTSKGNSESENSEETESVSAVSISSVIGKILNCVIVLIAIVEALTVLNIEAISAPALSIIDAIFGAVPNIIMAAIVVALGIVIANIACALISNILKGLNVDGLVKKIMPGMKSNFSLTRVAVGIIRVLIILFVVAEGVEILGLTVISSITSVIISYLPMLIKAIAIAIAALFAANLLESVLSKSKMTNAIPIKLLKSIIYVVAAFMILSQLEFATTIVNYAFIISLSALAVAFAISFGLGGRDFAKRTLDKVNLTKTESQENSTEEK